MNLLEDSVTLSFSPLFLELLAKRGHRDPEAIRRFIHSDLKDLEDPFRMKGMAEAVKRIKQALARKERILIHGDYDVDGVTAATILARTLDVLEADIRTFLPERMKDGYGVSADEIQRAHEDGVSLLITADCGITAHEEIQKARSYGIDVIVIDHHRIPK
ncbi:MAG TPA: DHH family phosphoesterase, partial [bacterium]|nr:DHH family phosphoesterase [bacterium]